MYNHAYLTYGKDLHGEELKQVLNDIFSQYHSDTMVEKPAPIANSQRNESFNSTVGSKNPKIRFYGESESNDFRVACAVAQTNVGYGYICRTLNSLGIEPGTNCEAYVDGMKRKRDGDSTRKKSLKFKKRRNEIHTNRIHGILSSEKKEGKTYETNIEEHIVYFTIVKQTLIRCLPSISPYGSYHLYYIYDRTLAINKKITYIGKIM
jgi:hypothetical protein